MSATNRGYRFAARDETGVLLGLSWVQCVAAGMGLVIDAVLLQAGAPLGFLAVPPGVGLLLGFAAIDGQPLLNLVIPRLRHHLAPRRNLTPLSEYKTALPPMLGNVRAENDADGTGLIVAGRWLSTVLPVSGLGFGLAPTAEQDQLAASWSDVLASLAGDRHGVSRIMLTVRLDEHAATSTVTVTQPVSRRNDGTMTTDRLRQVLSSTGLNAETPWSATDWSTEVARRLAGEPGGVMAIDVGWSSIRVDGAWHRCLWVADWPRGTVPADWFTGALSHAGWAVTWVVVMEPVPAVVSRRRAQRDATRLATDEEHRARSGFRIPAGLVRAQAEVADREAAVTGGHAEYDLCAVCVVTALSEDDLAAATADTIGNASRTGLTLRTLYGRQREALGLLVPGAMTLRMGRQW